MPLRSHKARSLAAQRASRTRQETQPVSESLPLLGQDFQLLAAKHFQLPVVKRFQLLAAM